jgi:cytochrome c
MLFARPRYGWPVVGAAAVVFVLTAAAGTTVWLERHRSEGIARAMAGGNPARAPELIRRYGCAGCHTISGIPGGDGQVGGPLKDMRQRVYVGGVVINSPDNLIRWIVSPQTFSPRSAMPVTGISETEARDVATYLYSR